MKSQDECVFNDIIKYTEYGCDAGNINCVCKNVDFSNTVLYCAKTTCATRDYAETATLAIAYCSGQQSYAALVKPSESNVVTEYHVDISRFFGVSPLVVDAATSGSAELRVPLTTLEVLTFFTTPQTTLATFLMTVYGPSKIEAMLTVTKGPATPSSAIGNAAGHRLTTGAKVGIGIGLGLGFCLLACGAVLYWSGRIRLCFQTKCLPSATSTRPEAGYTKPELENTEMPIAEKDVDCDRSELPSDATTVHKAALRLEIVSCVEVNPQTVWELEATLSPDELEIVP